MSTVNQIRVQLLFNVYIDMILFAYKVTVSCHINLNDDMSLMPNNNKTHGSVKSAMDNG